MTLDDAYEILAILQVAYPHSFKGISGMDTDATAKLWQRIFADDPYPQVEAAVHMLIASRTVGYSPTIGEVKEKLRTLRASNELTETEAWSLVYKACCNGYYGYKAEYEKLPPAVQKAVGRAEQLREWAVMDVDTVQSVVASNFMRSYRAITAREKELSVLPEEIQRMLLSTTNNTMLEGKDT